MKRTKAAWLTRGSAIALIAAAGIALSACSGSDGLTKAEEEALQQELEEAEREREEAQQRADDAEEEVEEAEQRADDAEEEAEEAEQRADDAEEDAEQAREEAAEQLRQERQKAEAGQRGRGLLTALEAVYDEANTSWAAPGNTATAGINDGQTDIELTASPLTGSTRKSGNFYTATLSRTAPGVNQPERKIVAYSDREKSRTFANHYASSIDADVGGTTSNPRFVNTDWVGDLLSGTIAAIVSNPSRGGHTATIAGGAANPADKMVNTLSASVHGVSGHYGCYNNTTNAACKINVAAAYDGAADVPQELTGLTITPEAGGTLYFDPGGSTISLLNVAKTGAPATTDEQYITFGWWQETPAMADGTYQAAVFATITPTTAYSGATGSAEYQGPAVGLYVDLKFDGSETTYESGEFTATAILRADFAATSVEGDVTNFQTTHGAKNWHVKLENGGDAEIVQAGVTDSTGTWAHSFLARHGNVPTADTQPIAVTGQFDASIPNVRHIVGAFGAHRTTDPLGSQ